MKYFSFSINDRDGSHTSIYDYDDPSTEEVISALMTYFENKQKERIEKPEDLVCMVSFADAPQNVSS